MYAVLLQLKLKYTNYSCGAQAGVVSLMRTPRYRELDTKHAQSAPKHRLGSTYLTFRLCAILHLLGDCRVGAADYSSFYRVLRRVAVLCPSPSGQTSEHCTPMARPVRVSKKHVPDPFNSLRRFGADVVQIIPK